MELLEGTVVVTGAASGIGAALVEHLRAVGATTVVAADVDRSGATGVAERCGAVPWHTDVSDEASILELIDGVEAAHGPISLFCSNAGILTIGGPEASDEDWQRTLEVNVLAHVWVARHLVDRMLARGGGTLLVTASAAGLLTQIGSAPYAVSKHAALAFAEWLAITYGERGLRVAALCPQAVATAMTAGIPGGGVAGVDGMLGPEAVADVTWRGLTEGRFLILPHPEVATYAQRRATDHDRWIRGMQRLQRQFPSGA